MRLAFGYSWQERRHSRPQSGNVYMFSVFFFARSLPLIVSAPSIDDTSRFNKHIA